jgi:putative ABC transport system permease protein
VKNWRRSGITCLAIGLGFAAVNLFGGFTEYMYRGNREVAIYANAQGHLTIFKKGFLEEGTLDPARYLLTPDEMKMIKEICQKNPLITLITPQLQITGLVTNGEVSTIFVAQGIVPSASAVFARSSTFLKDEMKRSFEGRNLEDNTVYGVGMARGLARLLDLKIGSNAVAFSNTVNGQMNALDLEVFQLFDTPSDVMNDKFMRVPFSFAQALYDTDRADRIAILLNQTKYAESIRKQLQSAFKKKGMEVEIKTWNELSDWYRKVKDMFDVIFLFLFAIVFIIVVMSVVNTMSMAVLERTREIGTLRALGLKCRGVVKLFAIESGLLGVLGSIGGLLLTFLGWAVVDICKPTWVPPGITRRVPIIIEFVPEFMLDSFFFLLVLCLISSLVPARRAAQQNVVEALGHV